MMFSIVIFVLTAQRCFSMQDEDDVGANAFTGPQPMHEDMGYASQASQTVGLPFQYPSRRINNLAESSRDVYRESRVHCSSIVRPNPGNGQEAPSTSGGGAQNSLSVTEAQVQNLRNDPRPGDRRFSYITLDLDSREIPAGVGLKRYGERVILITNCYETSARINILAFGNIKTLIPIYSRSVIILVFSDEGGYKIMFEYLMDNKWVSKEFVETEPKSNQFIEVRSHINYQLSFENFNAAGGRITPVDLVLPTHLDITDPKWLDNIPEDIAVVDMPGKPVKYYELADSRIKIDSAKIGDITIFFYGDQKKIIWLYNNDKEKKMRVENFSIKLWYGEMWREEGRGSNKYRLIESWAFEV